MRNIAEVIDQMLKQIPEEEVAIRAALLDNYDSICYAAPEMIPTWWQEVGSTLSYHILKPFKPWEITVISIWTTLSEEEVIKQFG